MSREDPLSPGILDMFFRKYRIMCLFSKREFLYLKIAQIFNWFILVILIEVSSSIPYLVWKGLSMSRVYPTEGEKSDISFIPQ
jgi:hypothetical protein